MAAITTILQTISHAASTLEQITAFNWWLDGYPRYAAGCVVKP
jgi:hypothetical protein